MRLSNLFTKTSKDVASDEISKNAQLLMKAGFIHKTMSGVYAMLPLGLRVLNKVENIVRDEMTAIGSQEMLMNALNPKKLWTDTNRWENVDILFKLKSQTENEYALACSHEEQVTPLVKSFVKSWKDLPICDGKNTFPLSVFQVQTKFRDELRSKSGLLRGREFRMKDMYDFHQNEESLDKSYDMAKQAYANAYERMGLEVYATVASGGIFTTNLSHEFQAICDAGEDKIYKVPSLGIFFNEEMAPVKAKEWSNMDETRKPREDILAKDIIGVDQVAAHFGILVEQTTKTLFYETHDGKMIAACVRGNYKINEEKLMKVSGKHLKLASESIVKKYTGAEIGYAGLIDLPKEVEIFMDESCADRKNFEMGTNKSGYHSINLNFGVDIPEPDQFYDIKIVEKGDLYPETGEEYQVFVSAEVGNIFKLGTKYTKSIDFTYTDQNNQKQLVIMGCYGIGTTRCMAVIAEIYSDEKGLKWPKSVTPFMTHLVVNINEKDEEGMKTQIQNLADQIYSGELILNDQNNEFKLDKSTIKVADQILYDDRVGLNMGAKLTDAELIGCPYILIISKRSLESGGVELKVRATAESFILKI